VVFRLLVIDFELLKFLLELILLCFLFSNYSIMRCGCVLLLLLYLSEILAHLFILDHEILDFFGEGGLLLIFFAEVILEDSDLLIL